MSSSNIIRFMHCARCIAEPAQPPRIEAGITPEGDLQVWCTRHDIEVVTIELPQGSKLSIPACAHCAAGQPHTH